MATYIAGVTDYIPHLQPFRPDLNLLNYALQTKQAQYQQGYSKISSIYGTLLNSPMLRESDITRRDEFFQRAQSEIQKMSEIDLSRSDNVNAAFSVFQPLIDDPNITSDMAYTKQYHNELSRAEGFRNCVDPKKCGGSWWSEGEQALGYWADEYSRTDDGEALSFERPRFTPYNSAYDKALSITKDLGISVKSTGVGRDGNFIYTTKNGQQIVGPLADILNGMVGSDPLIKETYRTKAYVDYKSTVKALAPLFNGNEEMAEDRFLTEKLNQLTESNTTQKRKLDSAKNAVTSRKDLLGSKINDGTPRKSDNPLVQSYVNYIEQEELLNKASGVTQTVTDNLDRNTLVAADRKMKRQRLLDAYASTLLQSDLTRAAYDYAMLTKEITMEVNPYQKSYYDYQLDMMKMGEKFKYDISLATLKGQLAFKKKGLTGEDLVANPEPSPGGSDPSIDPLVYLHGQMSRIMTQNSDLMDQANGKMLLRLQNDIDNVGGPASKSAASYLNQIFGPQVIRELNGSTNLKDSPTYQRDKNRIYNSSKALLDQVELEHGGIKSQVVPYENDIHKNTILAGRYAQNIRKNDNNVRQQMIADTPSKAAEINSLFENGLHTNRFAYANKYGEQATRKIFDEFYPRYRSMMTSSVPGLTTVDVPGQTGGLAKQAGRIPIDSYQGATSTFNTLTDAVRNMDAEGFIGFVPGTSPVLGTEVTGKPLPGEEWDNDTRMMYDVAKTFQKDYAAEVAAGKGTKKARGDVVIHPIAMNNANVTGYSIQPSEAWIEQYVGSNATKGLTYDKAKIRQGFTLLFNSSNAPSFFDNFSPSVNKRLLNYGVPITIKGYEDYGGQVTFEPTPQGTFNVKGWRWVVDPNTGNRYKSGDVTSLGTRLSGDIDAQYQRIEKALSIESEKNRELLDPNYNPTQRGNITSTDQIIQMMQEQYGPGPNANVEEPQE